MNHKIIAIIILMLVALCGCKTADDVSQSSQQPNLETPSAPQVAAATEEVIIPAHEPEPAAEPEPEVEAPTNILEEHKDGSHFLHGDPDIGQVINVFPRKVNVVFNYPLTEGTEVKVLDEIGKTNYVTGETDLGDEDLLVAIVYLKDMEPGIYKVEYNAIFAGKKEAPTDGYYYFRIQ